MGLRPDRNDVDDDDAFLSCILHHKCSNMFAKYAKSGGQPIWQILGTKVECDKIFQMPPWLTFSTVCS